MQHQHIDHAIDYIEFTAPDLSAIKKFYGEVFDWKFQDWGDEYISFNDGRVDGGFSRGTAKAGSGPLVILYSSGLEAIQAIALNGAISGSILELP